MGKTKEEDEEEEEQRGRGRGSTFPRRGLEVMLCCSPSTESHRFTSTLHTQLRYSPALLCDISNDIIIIISLCLDPRWKGLHV